jgi:adenosylcobinamide-phosphate synthase
MVSAANALGAAGGLIADRLVGEPPAPYHPVAAFGRAAGAAERRMWADSRARGVAFAGLAVGTPVAVGAVASGAGWVAAWTWVAVAGRMLGEVASDLHDALAGGDLVTARQRLPELVGRDPTELGAGEVARAVVESVAENTVDAVVAPAFWAWIAGAPGVAGHRAVNTLDALVGHRSARHGRFGWASARLDDASAWVPARLTAVLVAAARPRRAAEVWTAVRTQAAAHPSPNAGVAEAAFAAALGLRLGGVNRYGSRAEHRPFLGDGRPAAPADIPAAIRLSRDVTELAAAALLAMGLGARWWRR